MSLPKMMVVFLTMAVVLQADWTNEDKSRLANIDGNLGDIKSDIRSYMGDSFTYYNNVSMMPSASNGVLVPWLLTMTYGVEVNPRHVGGSNEHWDLQPNVPTDDYLTAFGLKGGYEDNTQYYLDYVRAFNQNRTYENGYLDSQGNSIDNWLMFAPSMDIMNTLNEANFGSWGSAETKTQSEAIFDTYNTSVSETGNLARNLQARLLAIANNSIGGSNYTGDLFEINFVWLHTFLENCTRSISNNAWTFSVPWMLEKRYVFTLRPDPTNNLYPLYSAWSSRRSYIDVFVAFVCYLSVFAFIVSRVYMTITK